MTYEIVRALPANRYVVYTGTNSADVVAAMVVGLGVGNATVVSESGGHLVLALNNTGWYNVAMDAGDCIGMDTTEVVTAARFADFIKAV